MGHDQVNAVFDSGLSGVISSIALGDKGNLHQLAHHWLNLLGPLGHLCAFLFDRWGNPQPQQVAQCAYSQVDLAAPDVSAAAGLPASRPSTTQPAHILLHWHHSGMLFVPSFQRIHIVQLRR